MSSGKYSVRTYATACGRPKLNPFYGTEVFNLRYLIVALMVTLAGCATPDRAPDLTPPVHISDSTWWQVESDIGAASLAATVPAENFARGSMVSWRSRVYQRTEDDFIPWFTCQTT